MRRKKVGNTSKANISAWSKIVKVIIVGDKQESINLLRILSEKFLVNFSKKSRLPREASRDELIIELVKSTDSRFHEGTLVPGWYQLKGIFSRHALFVAEDANRDQVIDFAEALRQEFFLSREEREAKFRQRLEQEEAERLQRLRTTVQQLRSFRHDHAPLRVD